MFAYCNNNPVTRADPSGMDSQIIDLGGGWFCRIDSGNEGTRTRQHIHVWKKGEQYAQNDDGSPHDKGSSSRGRLPRKVNDRLIEKTGWDYNGKREEFFSATKMELPDSGYRFIYADGTEVFVPEKRVGYICLFISTSIDSLEGYYYDSVSCQESTADNTGGSLIGFVPVFSPVTSSITLPIGSFYFWSTPILMIA